MMYLFFKIVFPELPVLRPRNYRDYSQLPLASRESRQTVSIRSAGNYALKSPDINPPTSSAYIW